MTDSARAAIEQGLASSNPEHVFDAITDIGKQGRRELADRVVPYLTSPTDFLREAAVRTLVFHFHLPAHKADALRLLDSDPDEGVRQAAAMGLRVFAQTDPDLLQHLLRVALKTDEDESVREAAFIAALVAASIKREEFPMGRWLPGFDRNADWALLERALRDTGHPVPPGVAERAARPR
jgi:HEAT repeat protein